MILAISSFLYMLVTAYQIRSLKIMNRTYKRWLDEDNNLINTMLHHISNEATESEESKCDVNKSHTDSICKKCHKSHDSMNCK